MTFAFLLQGIWSLQHIAHGSTTSPTSINASIVVIANRLVVCFVVSNQHLVGFFVASTPTSAEHIHIPRGSTGAHDNIATGGAATVQNPIRTT